MKRSLSVVVPAYNEEKRLPGSLCAIRRYFDANKWDFIEILVVDDGSRDQTREVAEAAGARVVRNERNRGKGYSVRRGMFEARGELILSSDADLSTPIEEIEKVLEAMDRTSASCGIGSRALDRSLVGIHQPIHREILGRAFNLLMRFQTGLRIRDSQCGFKLFNASVAREVFSRQRLDGFGFDVEVLFIAQKLGYTFVEVPVRWNDVAGTKVSWARGAMTFLDPVRIRWNEIMGKYDAPGAGSCTKRNETPQTQ